jgi:hypothetical protein
MQAATLSVHSLNSRRTLFKQCIISFSGIFHNLSASQNGEKSFRQPENS